MLLASGYGNNPNTRTAMGYVKVSLADGRHWDLLAGRPVTGDDRGEVGAGPMRWTCVEPLKKWRLDVEPTTPASPGSSTTNPPPEVGVIADEGARQRRPAAGGHVSHEGTGRWTGWVEIDGQRISVDGFHGGRDRTFGVRVADKIDFWLWLDAGFEDRAIEAWIIESSTAR